MTPPKVALLGVPYDSGSSYQRGPAGAPVLLLGGDHSITYPALSMGKRRRA